MRDTVYFTLPIGPFVYAKAYIFIKTDSLNILLVHIDFRYLQMIYGISNQFFPNSCTSIIIGNKQHFKISFCNSHKSD